ncbi:MAG: hypothetical protein LT082_11185 [Comamonas sp.]|jgi:hypothetical protein|nr:hypothetical protein [Comamonas sp.]
MVTGRTPPRFVPTLTDVVDVPAPLPQADPAAAAPAVPTAPVSADVRRDAPVEANFPLSDEMETAIAERVHALLEERLDRALDFALQDLRPLVREAVLQVLARR